MSKTAMTLLKFFKKVKGLNPLETSSSILGFILTTVCIICCFLFIDYRAVEQGFSFSATNHHTTNTSSSGHDGFSSLSTVGGDMNERPGFHEETGDGCDLFDGDWVWDENYPLYDFRDCMAIGGGFRCSANGRPDSSYTKWRWQPKNCNLPRFDALEMLERLRNRRLVFVGDSLGRNQWESALCMLASAVSNKSSIYEVNGRPITKHTGFLIYKFSDFNCTVEYYRSPFLVAQIRAPKGSPDKVKTTLKLDQIDWTFSRWKDADLLVFNTGHWWNFEKTIRGGCYFQEDKDVKMEMTVESAYQKSVETLLNWIDGHVNMSKSHVFFRTYSPVHFSGGDWKTGGSCYLETLPDLNSSHVPPQTWPHFSLLLDLLSERSNKSQPINMNLINVTYLTSQRRDGHLSVYYKDNEGPVPLQQQDCSHWCLPGVPDTWNELLFALFLKQDRRKVNISQN